MSDRDAFRASRDVAKAKLHEKRLEAATYTAAEVKVLTEAALRLGRKEAAEEIAAAIQREIDDEFQCNNDVISGLSAALMIAEGLASQPSGAVSDERSGTTEPQGPAPEAAKTPHRRNRHGAA